MKLAVSTSWTRRGESAVEMMTRAAELGFSSFELGVRPRAKDVPEILAACHTNGWTLASLHNPVVNAHLPEDLMRGDAIASLDEDLRRQGLEDLLRTIDIAEEAGAPVVVLHAGRVELPSDSRKRNDLFRRTSDQGDDQAHARLLKERLDKALPSLDCLARSLERVLEQPSPVRVALESRYHYDEIPVIDELEWIFRRFDTDRIAYWHDVGHCEVLARLGVDAHHEWLERFASKLAGFHLHDIVGLGDHQPVGKGDMDFPTIADHAGENVIPVIEPEHTWTDDELRESARALADMGFGAFP